MGLRCNHSSVQVDARFLTRSDHQYVAASWKQKIRLNSSVGAEGCRQGTVGGAVKRRLVVFFLMFSDNTAMFPRNAVR